MYCTLVLTGLIIIKTFKKQHKEIYSQATSLPQGVGGEASDSLTTTGG